MGNSLNNGPEASINLSIRDKLNQELDPQKFAKLELERLKVRATS
jgi:hypothetical protein